MSTTVALPSEEQIRTALTRVQDPEIKRPITELGMLKGVDVEPDGRVQVGVYLTVSGCPLKATIVKDVTEAVSTVDGVTDVNVDLDVMSDEQRQELKAQLRGGRPEKEIPFARSDSLTRVYAVASGKGGVGKSSVTANLAAAMAQNGLTVGVIDADIYGHSIPRMLGVDGQRPTVVDEVIMPIPAHGVKVISTEMFKPDRNEPVAWRGPMLHRALQQFMVDVYWGDLDVLLLDLPPGTGDVAISLAQLLPHAELLVVTTPQLAAAEVAERAGSIAMQTHQRIAGVIENMSYLQMPGSGERMELFGAGGGRRVAEGLSARVGGSVPLLGEIPIEVQLRESGDRGDPLVLEQPELPAAAALQDIAKQIGSRQRGLSGMSLSVSPTG